MVAPASAPALIADRPAAQRSSHPLRVLRVGLIMLLLVGAIVGAAALAVPYVIKTTAPNWLQEKTGQILAVRDTAFNTFTLHLRMDDATLCYRGKLPARFSTLEVPGSWESLTQLA